MAIHNESDQQRHMRFQKQWLSSVKVIVVLIYFVIVPYLYTPAWCMQYYQDNKDLRNSFFTLDCKKVILDGGLVPFSKMPKLAP